MHQDIQNIVLIGSGNLAWHFLNAFTGKGIRVLQILASNELTAQHLSTAFSVPYILNPLQLDLSADLYILSVQDDQIKAIAKELHLTDQLLVHTSGFTGLDSLEGSSANTGVIWPLQTFTTGKALDYKNIPFFIESNSTENQERLSSLVKLVSQKVIVTDSRVRQKIHLAAVIASNLTNHLYTIAGAILEKHNIPFEVLTPLILETAVKASLQHPFKSQTGPAVREDLNVIAKHLAMLADDQEFQEIYRLLTKNIIRQHLSDHE